MTRPVIWRVRVLRTAEVFVDILAINAAQAELEAAKLPQVVQVFGKSAIRGDEATLPERPPGVEE
jgi:hypothetical protein